VIDLTGFDEKLRDRLACGTSFFKLKNSQQSRSVLSRGIALPIQLSDDAKVRRMQPATPYGPVCLACQTGASN
jgi:hypothetical protein